LALGQAGTENSLQGVVVSGGPRWRVEAGRVRLGPVLGIVALSDRIQPALRAWLLQASPDALLTGVSLAGDRDGLVRGSGRVAQLAFRPVGERPGVSGLGGDFLGDGQ